MIGRFLRLKEVERPLISVYRLIRQRSPGPNQQRVPLGAEHDVLSGLGW